MSTSLESPTPPTGTSRPGRVPPFRSLDAWRGFAALWVVMGHAAIKSVAPNGEFPNLAHSPLYAFSIWAQLGVVLFFVISGFCITGAAYSILANGRTVGRFFLDRFRRIYPPYLAAWIIAEVQNAGIKYLIARHILPASNKETPVAHGLTYYFSHLTLTQFVFGIKPVPVVVWTLCYEAAFYVIVGVALLVVNRLRASVQIPTLFTLLNAFTIGTLLLLLISPQSSRYPIDLWYQFGLGALLFQWIAVPSLRPQTMKVGAVVAVMTLAFAVLYSMGEGGIGHPSTRIMAVTALVYSALLLILHPVDEKIVQFRVVRMLGALGIFSYSLYLSHTLFQWIIHQIGKRFLHVTEGTFFLSFWAQVLVPIGIAYVFFWLFERPFLKKPGAAPAQKSAKPDTTPEPVLPASVAAVSDTRG